MALAWGILAVIHEVGAAPETGLRSPCPRPGRHCPCDGKRLCEPSTAYASDQGLAQGNDLMLNLRDSALVRSGVKARLLMAFGVMLLLTLAVGLVGWLALERTERAIATLQSESLPALYRSMQLAEQSNSLILQAQVVSTSRLAFHLDEQGRRLREQLESFLRLAQSLPDQGPRASPAESGLIDLARHIESVLLELIEVARQNIHLRAAMQGQLFRLASLRSDLGAGSSAAVERLVGTLRAGANVGNHEQLADLEADFRSTLATQRGVLERDDQAGAIDPQAEHARDLAAIGEGPGNLFEVGRLQLDNADRRAYLLTVSSAVASQLVDRVSAHATAVTEAARTRSAEASAAFAEARRRILLLAGACLLAAALSAVYVVRDLGGNLSAVTGALRQLAGGSLHVQVPATGRGDEIGTLARLFSVFRENTLKLNEASLVLREKTRLQDTILESMTDGLSAFDGAGRLVAWNTRFVELYELPLEQLRNGTSLEEIYLLLKQRQVVTRSPTGELIPVAHINRQRTLRQERFEQQLHNGRVVELRSSPMPGGGFVTIYTDLTERKATEEQLRQAQKMEIVGQLTGGIAHDFNNLLAVIMGNLNMLQERLAGQPELHRQARRALDAADRGALLTQRLLAFSRNQALQPQELDVNDLVEAMLDLLEYSVGESITIRTELAPDLWRSVIDPGQLENSLMNLAVNSRDAMPEGGELAIATANLRVSAAEDGSALEPGDYVTLSVTDTGSGMPPEVLGRVFEPFFTTKDVGEGSGLGLSMVYGFVRQSGGEVQVESVPGRGTQVTLVFPRASTVPETAADTAREDGATPPAPAGGLVMVVEDDPAVREVTVDLLRGLGYRTVEAADGTEGLDLLERTPEVTVLLADVVLPGTMTGPELALEAERLRPGLRVLYCSGYSRDALTRQGRVPEGVMLLQKPFRKDALARKLEELLR